MLWNAYKRLLAHLFSLILGSKKMHQIPAFLSVSAGLQSRVLGLFNIAINGDPEFVLQHPQRLRPAASRHEWNAGGIWKRNITPVIAGKLCAFVPLARVMESIFRPLEVA